MDKSYKARKEDFVSNLSGGDLLEINLVTLVAPAAVLLWSALQSRQSCFIPYRPIAFVADFLLNVGAVLFATTAYSSVPLLLNILLISPTVFLSLTSKQKVTKKAKPPPKNDGTQDTSSPEKPSLPSRPFLTTYRASMMIVTCLAILAVDFRIFPRRFAKAENWGTSLMDMGVGSFVFSAGVVSARAILSNSSQPKEQRSLLHRLIGATRHSLPLLILGLIRLYSVKGLDYAEHVTEYGVHWNFFFTLAFLSPFVEIFHSLATIIVPSYELLAIFLATTYEVILNTTDLKSYIMVSPRGDTLLSKNREGVFSFVGYLAIFLAGRGIGLIVIPDRQSTSPKSRRTILLQALATRSALYWLLFFILTLPHLRIPPIPQSWDANTPSILSFSQSIPVVDLGLGLSVSRRLANLPYVLWVTAFNTMQILLFCLIETIYFPDVNQQKTRSAEESELAVPRIMKAFNKNGLAIFLIANLLTGVVNLSIKTIDVGPLASMGILVGYAAVVTGVALSLDFAGVKLKL